MNGGPSAQMINVTILPLGRGNLRNVMPGQPGECAAVPVVHYLYRPCMRRGVQNRDTVLQRRYPKAIPTFTHLHEQCLLEQTGGTTRVGINSNYASNITI